MKNITVGFIFLGYLLLGTGCPKPCPTIGEYHLQASMRITPDSEFLERGDTLRFTSIVPVNMIDQGSGNEINFSGAVNFGTNLGIRRLGQSSNVMMDAVGSFDYRSIVGKIFTDSVLAPNRVKQLLYKVEANNYKLIFELIPKDTGVFALFVGNAVNVTRVGKRNCDRENIQILLDNKNKHLHYLQDLYYKDQPMADGDKTHGYCFVVK